MNTSPETREVWLRGPLSDTPPLLQPIAHALMQAREEVQSLMHNFPESKLWERPANIASAGFHLQHLTGVLDRLFTYARAETLSTEQLNALASEGKPSGSVQKLVRDFDNQVERSLIQLRKTEEQTLTEVRGVGRAQLPSTVIGLLTHSAEHTMRHVGQLSVTVRILISAG
ncbi:hypothetical protein GCM10028805_17160 [Spirosoma harenae]